MSGNADSFKPFRLYLHVLIFTTSVIALSLAVITMLCQFLATIEGKLMYCRIWYVLTLKTKSTSPH